MLNEFSAKKALETPERYSVFYYCSTEEYLLRNFSERTLRLLTEGQDAEVTRVEGPAPSIAEVVASAGTISMFGTKRVVELWLLDPAAMNDADVAALCDVMQSLENAVLVITTLLRDEKTKPTKKAKQLLDAAESVGFAAMLAKPQMQDAKRFASECAKATGASLTPQAASALVERCGMDFFALKNEVDKLAAAADYKEITPEMIQRFGTQSIDADVFDMVRFVTAKRTAQALAKLRQLLELQNEPIAIAAALSGSFVDMYRVKCGSAAKRSYTAVHKDFAYKGSDYRLKKAGETAAGYTQAQLAGILKLLAALDLQLKRSSASGDVLLQAALCEIAQIGAEK